MTTCEAIAERYLSAVESELSCTPIDENRLLIDTPYSFSDGDVIQVVLESLSGGETVRLGDEGATIARLKTVGVSSNVTRFSSEAHPALRALRVDLVGDELRVEGAAMDAGEMLVRLVGAMRELDGLKVLRPIGQRPRFDSKVLSFLQSQFPDVKERPRVVGVSGARYRLTAGVPRGDDQVLVYAIAGGSRETGSRGVDHAFRVFSDVNGHRSPAEKLVVLSQEEEDPWQSSDIRLLSQVAYVGGWDHRERLTAFLTGRIPDNRIMLSYQPSL
jgi:hypothetical protein